MAHAWGGYCVCGVCDRWGDLIGKWLKQRVPEGCVIHSFRHSLRDRLRAFQCPSDMIDQIGGWSTAGVGQAYGLGYGLDMKWEWLERIN